MVSGVDEGNTNEDVGEKELQKDKESLEREWSRLVTAAKELGGYVADVGRAFERLWKMRAGSAVDEDILDTLLDDEDEDMSPTEIEIKSLLTTLVLFRKIFVDCDQDTDGSSSALLSPPPSPGRPAANSKEVSDVTLEYQSNWNVDTLLAQIKVDSITVMAKSHAKRYESLMS